MHWVPAWSPGWVPGLTIRRRAIESPAPESRTQAAAWRRGRFLLCFTEQAADAAPATAAATMPRKSSPMTNKKRWMALAALFLAAVPLQACATSRAIDPGYDTLADFLRRNGDFNRPLYLHHTPSPLIASIIAYPQTHK